MEEEKLPMSDEHREGQIVSVEIRERSTTYQLYTFFRAFQYTVVKIVIILQTLTRIPGNYISTASDSKKKP